MGIEEVRTPNQPCQKTSFFGWSCKILLLIAPSALQQAERTYFVRCRQLDRLDLLPRGQIHLGPRSNQGCTVSDVYQAHRIVAWTIYWYRRISERWFYETGVEPRSGPRIHAGLAMQISNLLLDCASIHGSSALEYSLANPVGFKGADSFKGEALLP